MRAKPRCPDPDREEGQIGQTEEQADLEHELSILILPGNRLITGVFGPTSQLSLVRLSASRVPDRNKPSDLAAVPDSD